MDKYDHLRWIMNESRRMRGAKPAADKYEQFNHDMDDAYEMAAAAEVRLFRQNIEVDFTPEQEAANPIRQRMWLENMFLHNYADAMGWSLMDVITDEFYEQRQREIAYLRNLGQ